jgi:hypothetical protein
MAIFYISHLEIVKLNIEIKKVIKTTPARVLKIDSKIIANKKIKFISTQTCNLFLMEFRTITTRSKISNKNPKTPCPT